MRRIIALVVAGILIFSSLNISVFSDSNKTIVVLNDIFLKDIDSLIIEGNNILIPVRAIFESLNSEVMWDNTSKSINIVNGNQKYILRANDDAIKLNNQLIKLSTKIRIINNKVYASYDIINKVTGATVAWNKQKQILDIKTINKIYDSSKKLALAEFYRNINRPIISNDASKYKVQPLVDPQMGWKTDGKPANSPTKIATDGLQLIIAGKVTEAEACAKWLLDNSTEVNGSMFFPFEFDFAPYWPYDLKAPWNSGLTQGLALGLFSYLYYQTGNIEYMQIADKVYNSFKVPVEQGGVVRYEEEGPFIEEYAADMPIRVLNGSAVAMLAIRDYSLIMDKHEANDFFRELVERFEKLLPLYELKVDEYDFVIPSYSLAPNRTEMLGRFIGSGQVVVNDVKLIGKKDDEEIIISAVDIGELQDSNVMEDFYIWYDKLYMGWGQIVNKDGISGRNINNSESIYKHSPFKFVFPSDFNEYEKLQLEISYSSNNDEKLDVQLYDNIEWWSIGEITNNNQILKIDIPQKVIENVVKTTSEAPLPDEKYIDDNQILIDLVSKYSNSSIFESHADRWVDSTLLTPAQWINNPPENIIKDNTSKLALTVMGNAGELREIASPYVIKVDNMFFMFYGGIGLDNRWRIYQATSKDGINWVKQGLIFEDAKLPFDGDYYYPYIVKQNNSENNMYYMYFSARNKLNEETNIYVAQSSNGWTWQLLDSVINVSGTSHYISTDINGKYELYYVEEDSTSTTIKKLSSLDGSSWGQPETVLIKNKRLGERIISISGFEYAGKDLILVKIATPRRYETRLFVKNEDGIEEVHNKTFFVDKDWINKWDSITNDYQIVKENNNYYIYFTGINKNGLKHQYSIGRAELDINNILKYISEIKSSSITQSDENKTTIYDFGTSNSPVWSESIIITEKTSYNKKYGWVGKLNTLKSGDDMTFDSFNTDYIKGTGGETFRINTENGLYEVALIAGTSKGDVSSFNFSLNGKSQKFTHSFNNITEVASPKSRYTTKTYVVAVTNGQLNIKFNNKWLINGILIKPYTLPQIVKVEYDKKDMPFNDINSDFYMPLNSSNAIKWSRKYGSDYKKNWDYVLKRRDEILKQFDAEDKDIITKLNTIAKYIDETTAKSNIIENDTNILNSPVDILDPKSSQKGSCTGLARTIAIIANSYNIPARLVNYYTKPEGSIYDSTAYPSIIVPGNQNIGRFHVEAEIFYDGKWRLITNGPYIAVNGNNAIDVVTNFEITKSEPSKQLVYINTEKLRYFSTELVNYFDEADKLEQEGISSILYDLDTAMLIYPEQNIQLFKLKNHDFNNKLLRVGEIAPAKGSLKIGGVGKPNVLKRLLYIPKINGVKTVNLNLIINDIKGNAVVPFDIYINGNRIDNKNEILVDAIKASGTRYSGNILFSVSVPRDYLVENEYNEILVKVRDGCSIELPVMLSNKLFSSSNEGEEDIKQLKNDHSYYSFGLENIFVKMSNNPAIYLELRY